MASEMPLPVHVSPYGPPTQGNGNGQPYLRQPEQSQGSQDGQTSNQYPQYSYDIRLRYPQDTTRSYPPPPSQPQGPQLPPMSIPGQDNGDYAAQSVNMDTTGQIAPIGAKPRVTATLWEDEGTLCFQVDVKGTCVARREDNHMINGTKLLNVAGMTRGRRDGILKSEKQKHVVKIGPMHLKGVWIPFERALEFANKEKITEMLYPLFVHNIGALLYHPINKGYAAAAQIPRSQELPPPNMAGVGGQGPMGPGRPPVPAGQRYEYDQF
ncbi:apses-domain-containing protein [Cadophora sp. DSE1049]|nr:apses-domain-containing protein [Cadophora sp. DSE1049]